MVPAKLQVVMGKGGVGRTTLSAALALAAAEGGERVALASLVGADDHLLALVRAQWGEPPPGLEVLELEPRGILLDGLGRLLPVPGLATLVTSHPGYEALYRIAPGVKEVAVLHRLLELADAGAHDRIVVDGLATGHGTHFLEAPRKGARLLAGRLAERARAVDAALTDPARAAVVLATTAEEMPVRETQELAAALRRGGFPVQAVVANRVAPQALPSPEDAALLERLTERATASAVASEVGAPWGFVRRLARAAAHLERAARDEAPRLAALRELGLPMALVPLLPREGGRLRAVAARLREAGL